MKRSAQTIIVGGGAAGIACAARLSHAKKDYLIIEARDRIAGRILGQTCPKTGVALELGAEFIHGAPPLIMQWCLKLGLPIVDALDTHLMAKKGKVRSRSKYWEELEALMKKLGRKRDRSVEEFLKANRNYHRAMHPYFRAFVEGFHGASLAEMGECGLADSRETDEALGGASLFRPMRSHASLIEGVQNECVLTANIHLSTRLERIVHTDRKVELHATGPKGEELRYEAERVVLTLPPSVLLNGQISFEPTPKDLFSSLECLRTGHVQKLVLQFRTRFWEQLSEQPIAFLHLGPKWPFPTFWTLLPVRSPHLIAWQGGPRAAEMADLSQEDIVSLCLRSLSYATGKSKAFLSRELETVYRHNWSQDPFTLGAYSYIAVDGMKGARRLARPFGRLLLAGEATVMGPERGTVSGAFASGLRAADQILA